MKEFCLDNGCGKSVTMSLEIQKKVVVSYMYKKAECHFNKGSMNANHVWKVTSRMFGQKKYKAFLFFLHFIA